MPRKSTVVRDRKILRLWRAGAQPKAISRRLGLSSVHVVYDALRRARGRMN